MKLLVDFESIEKSKNKKVQPARWWRLIGRRFIWLFPLNPWPGARELTETRVGSIESSCHCMHTIMTRKGSGGGSVGRVVASNTRDSRFESQHRQNFSYQLYNRNTEKTKTKKRRPGKKWPSTDKYLKGFTSADYAERTGTNKQFTI